MDTEINAARAAIEAEQRERITNAAREIQVILEKYQVQIIAVPTITADGRIAVNVQIADARK